MNEEILKEIQYSINKIAKIIDISTKKAQENICKKMNLGIIKYQIDQYDIYLKNIKKGKYKNKFHVYLYSFIIILENAYTNYMNAPCYTVIESQGFNANESLTNTKYLYERAANELYTVAYLFNISDNSNCHINENILNRICDKSIVIFSSSAIAAKYLKIVEMAPITDILDTYKILFDASDGDNPTIKELMGLNAANILI